MWTAPFRPSGQITQDYNDGIVHVYSMEDRAAPGYAPKPTPTLKISLRYAERRLGIQRYYEAMQNQIQVERVIRVPRSAIQISNQDMAQTEDGRRYRIDMVQSADGIYPPSLDLTLAKIEQGVNPWES